jgi:hypothetical protein
MAQHLVTPKTTTGLPGCGALAAALLSLGAGPALATAIDDNGKFAWSENAGWLNFKSTNNSTPVQVYADHLEGFVWHENLGWLRLGTYIGGGAHTYANNSKDTYGVNRDSGSGILSGFAWSENAGWINFGASGGAAAIDLTSGSFSGYVWGENVGWMHLSGTAQNNDPYGVKLATEGGQCGSANGVPSLQPPTTNLCTTGSAGAVTTANGNHTWTCAGIAGGNDEQCSAPGGSGGGGGGGSGSVTFEVTAGGCTVDSASVVPPPAGGPPNRSMPYGAIAFRLSGCTGATVQLSFSGAVAGWEYWKFIDGAWIPMTGVTLSGSTATITIVDNGPYDANPAVGAIDDPSGPAQAAQAQPVPIPTLSLWGLAASAGLLGLFGAWRQRRQRR